MMNPNVWIVLPSYNRHDYLIWAIDSVLAQTWRDFNLIVINDYAGRSDSESARGELEWIVGERADSRITLIHNCNNLGISATRNRAIRTLIDWGIEYLFFLDHDDVWIDPEKIEKQLWILAKWEIWILWTQYEVTDSVDRVIWSSYNPSTHEDMVKSMMLLCPILMSTLWVNAQVLKDVWLLNEQYSGTDDWEFFIRALVKYKWANLDDRTTQYRSFDWNTSLIEWHRLVREQILIIKELWRGLSWYHRALILAYIKLLIPPQYKSYLKEMRRDILQSMGVLPRN